MHRCCLDCTTLLIIWFALLNSSLALHSDLKEACTTAYSSIDLPVLMIKCRKGFCHWSFKANFPAPLFVCFSFPRLFSLHQHAKWLKILRNYSAQEGNYYFLTLYFVFNTTFLFRSIAWFLSVCTLWIHCLKCK